MKEERGITLVSLVVTIIILIILAGVSLNLTLGQNGIITKAKQAKENIELAKVEEETRLNELYNELEKEGDSSGISYDAIAKIKDLENKLSNLQNEFNNLQNEYNTFKTTIAEAITEMGVATAETADASTMANNIRSLLDSKSNSPYTNYLWGNPNIITTGGYGYLHVNKTTISAFSLDVSNMNTLHVYLRAVPHVSNGVAYSQTKWYVGVNTDQNTTSNNFVGINGQTSGTTTTEGWYTIDISNCTGEYYFVMSSSATGGSGWNAGFYIDTIYYD